LPKILRPLQNTVQRVVNQVATIMRPPRVETHTADSIDTTLPPQLSAAIQELGAGPVSLKDVCVKATDVVTRLVGVGDPTGVVALSADRNGVLQWHVPGLGPVGKRQIALVLQPKQLRSVGVFRFPRIQDLTLDLVHQAEVSLKHATGLKKFPAPGQPLAGVPANFDAIKLTDHAPGGELSLILIHGIIDRVHGAAFLPLLLNPEYPRLFNHYGGRVFGFDHYTISETPLENAIQLLGLLPRNQTIDIICHSRGGLVTRCLLEHPEVRTTLKNKGVTIRRVVFVGAANQGSPLARRENLIFLLSLLHNAHAQAARENGMEAGYLDKITKLIGAVAALAAGRIAQLPGVDALVPNSKLIGALNAASPGQMPQMFFVRANFGDSRPPLSVLEKIVKDVFKTELNDLVVPFNGVADLRSRTPTPLIDCALDDLKTRQGRDWHLTYFKSERVLQFIVEHLTAAG
jgi:hypothetical protein